MNRLSRSASSMMVASRSALAASSSDARHVAQRARRAEHGGQRRLEVVRDRGEERRAQALGLHRALDPVDVLDQAHALDRKCGLIDQGIQQAPLVRRQQRAGSVAVDAEDADDAAPGSHRQEQPLGAGQRIGVAAGGAVLLPGPAGGGEVGLLERILRRVAGLDGDGAVLGQQQHDPHLQHQRRLVGGGPERIVEGADAGQLAAEGVERLDGAHALQRRDGVGAPARGHVGDDDGNHREEHERRHIGGVGDGEGVDRRQEEEVVAQRGRHGGQQGRQQPEAQGDADDGHQQHEIDILDAEHRLHGSADARRDGNRQQRGNVGERIERLGRIGRRRCLRIARCGCARPPRRG